MATAKKATKAAPAVKKAVSTPVAAKKAAVKAPVKAAVKAVAKPVAKPAVKKAAPAEKPIKQTFTKAALATHIADHAQVELKTVKTVLASLESTIVRALHKNGIGEFTLPGLLKIATQKVPAKKKRVGKDPFTGVEREFAAKPATVRVKIRGLKKLKDSAL